MSPSLRFVEGRFLQADDMAGLRSQALEAESADVDALFVSEAPLGDPVVLAAALSGVVRRSDARDRCDPGPRMVGIRRSLLVS